MARDDFYSMVDSSVGHAELYVGYPVTKDVLVLESQSCKYLGGVDYEALILCPLSNVVYDFLQSTGCCADVFKKGPCSQVIYMQTAQNLLND